MRLLSVLMVLALSACTGGIRPDQLVKPPEVSLSDLRVTDFGLFEQRFAVDLRLRNPNPFPLPVTGMNYRLAINGRPLASGSSDRSLTLGAHDESLVSVGLVTRTSDALAQVRDLMSGERPFRYRLDGDLSVRGRELQLPFSSEGQFGSPSNDTVSESALALQFTVGGSALR